MAKEYENKCQIDHRQMWTDMNSRSATGYRQATQMISHSITNLMT